VTDRYSLIHGRLQLAVGQGGFHLGAVIDPRRPTTDRLWDASCVWIYDCGSEPRRHVDKAIDGLLATRRTFVDFLFLSHFDRDHICGTAKLLNAKTGMTAETVVIPYLDDTERMVAFGRTCALREGRWVDRIVGDLAIDPVAALRSLNVGRIIMIGAERDEGPPGEPANPPIGPEGEDGPRWAAKPLPESHDGHFPVRTTNDGAIFMQDTCFHVQPRAHAPAWRLIPYVRRAAPERIAEFELATEALLGWKRHSFREQMSSKAMRRRAVSKHRMQLGRAYRYAFEDKNMTSMSLYSGPGEETRVKWVYPDVSRTVPNRIGWVGTGDADLRDPQEIEAFEDHYGRMLDTVSTFVLPHHGSIHNSDPNRPVVIADTWVACAEPIHKTWNHPADELRDAIERRGRNFHHVRSDPSTSLFEVALVGWNARLDLETLE